MRQVIESPHSQSFIHVLFSSDTFHGVIEDQTNNLIGASDPPASHSLQIMTQPTPSFGVGFNTRQRSCCSHSKLQRHHSLQWVSRADTMITPSLHLCILGGDMAHTIVFWRESDQFHDLGSFNSSKTSLRKLIEWTVFEGVFRLGFSPFKSCCVFTRTSSASKERRLQGRVDIDLR